MRKARIALAAVALVAASAVAQRPAQQRIVSLGGSITEIVYRLGFGPSVVGVDQSSHVPAAADKLPKVGVFRSIPAEGILALAPTMLIGTTDVGPAAALTQIRSAGVSVKLVHAAESPDGALSKIRDVAAALGVPARGEALAREVAADIADARVTAGRSHTRPRVLFIYARVGSTLLVAGRATAADAMIALANASNAVTQFSGYRPLTAEAVVAAEPDVIVLPQRGLASIQGVVGVLALPGVSMTPAGRARRVVGIDDELLLGFGPRLGTGIRELAVAVHPDLARNK